MKNIFIISTLLICFIQANAQKKITKKPNTIQKSIKMSINELLQGKWQSLDDKTAYLVFENNQKKGMSIENKKWIESDSEPYVLSNKCLNDSNKDNGIEPEKDKYISCEESDMCWYIVVVNNTYLELSYLARGNTLRYKKLK